MLESRCGGGGGGKELAGVRRILVVEDDAPTRAVLLEVLNDEPDLAGEGADGGAAALERLRAGGGVDLVLCDLAMPGVDGFQVAARLKADAATAALPVVVITALDTAAVEAAAYAAGCVAVMAKPFDVVELAALLRGVLETAAGRPGTRR